MNIIKINDKWVKEEVFWIFCDLSCRKCLMRQKGNTATAGGRIAEKTERGWGTGSGLPVFGGGGRKNGIYGRGGTNAGKWVHLQELVDRQMDLQFVPEQRAIRLCHCFRKGFLQ